VSVSSALRPVAYSMVDEEQVSARVCPQVGTQVSWGITSLGVRACGGCSSGTWSFMR
jgi:hypothetical protein